MDVPKLSGSALGELKDMIIDISALPRAAQLQGSSMKKELSEFVKRFPPGNRGRTTTKEIGSFIAKHKLFELMDLYAKRFARQGTVFIVLEGGDATGKTVLVERLAKELDGAAVKNQSGYLFHDMFGFPKNYKASIIDYGADSNVVFLYYFVQNIYVMEKLLELSKGKKYAILDSFALRTMSSHRARPSFSGRSAGKIMVNREMRVLIDGKLNRMALEVIKKNSASLFFVFLYSSVGLRAKQAEQRGAGNAFDVNKRYYSYVIKYLKSDQEELKRAGVKMFSLLNVGEGEKRTGDSGIDAVFIQSGDLAADLKAKTSAIRRAIESR